MYDLKYKKLIVGISGATGAIYGITLLEILKTLNIESHLVISSAALMTISTETDLKQKDVLALADYVYNNAEIGSRISSGSFRTDGMIIAPCSMKTLSSIANGYENNLISRAAAVIIKERQQLTLMVRESPLSSINLKNMLTLSKIGVNICPPVPAFYNQPESIQDLVNHSVVRVLDLYNIETSLIKRWSGLNT